MVLSIIAIVISALSLLTSIIFGVCDQKNNKRTLKPLININTGDYEGDIFVDVENKGMGPLIIKKVEIYRSGVLCKETDLYKIIKTRGQPWYTFMEKLEGRTIPPDEKIRIIGIAPKTVDIREKIRRQ